MKLIPPRVQITISVFLFRLGDLRGAQAGALAKPLLEEWLITQAELMAKVSEERAVYQRMLKPRVQ